MLELIKGHKLDDVGGHVPAIGARVESLIVAIQLLHGGEVGLAYAHDNYGQGEVGTAHNLINRLVHVTDYPVSYHQQNVVLLVVLADIF